MDESDISPEQAKEMHERVMEMVGYLGALRRRMDERGFPPHGRFREVVEQAYDRVHGLAMFLHYLSCPGPIGKSRRRARDI
jgi:hypothetical protein